MSTSAAARLSEIAHQMEMLRQEAERLLSNSRFTVAKDFVMELSKDGRCLIVTVFGEEMELDGDEVSLLIGYLRSHFPGLSGEDRKS